MAGASGAEVVELVGLAKRFHELERRLNRIVVGQSDYAHALTVALMSGEHVALISPPGTGKSRLVRSLAKLVRGKFYQALLNPYITYDELFGPLDVERLARGEARRRWSSIVVSDIVFLDEGFKANPALLNTLLSFLNERVVYDPFTGTEIKVPLITAVVASNEVPEDPSLQALWDRFAIRVFADYIRSPATLYEAYRATWAPRAQEEHLLQPVLTVDEVRRFNRMLEEALRNPDAKKQLQQVLNLAYDLDTIIRGLVIEPAAVLMKRGKMVVSNRTLVQKWPKLFLASFLLWLNTYPPSIAMLRALRDLYVWQAGSREEVDQMLDNYHQIVGDLKDAIEIASQIVDATRHLQPPEHVEKLVKRLEQTVANAAGAKPPIRDIITKQLQRDMSLYRRLLNEYRRIYEAYALRVR